MQVKERLRKLRNLMKETKIDAYIIPTADFHQSEYVGEYFKCRSYISGFTGSYGTVVITKDDGRLWTDGRYFLQAEAQLADSGISLMRMNEDGVPTLSEWLARTLPHTATLGFDGRVVAMDEGQSYELALAKKNIYFSYTSDLLDHIWENRPELASKPMFFLEERYTGESIGSKLERVRKKMREMNANAHIIASLDDIAWLLNTRGSDIKYFPMFLAYAIVYTDKVDLFVDKNKLNEQLREEYAKHNIRILPYNHIYENVKQFTVADAVMLDPMKVNYSIYNNIPDATVKITCANPTILFKAMKNPIELQNIRSAHIKDGIALTKFMHWLKTNVGKDMISEISAAEKLEEFRKERDGYLWQSFEPICAYKEHAAMMHYAPTSETDSVLKPEHLLLCDTGGNYYEGSTDITRTFVLGALNEELKLHFTTVVRAMMNLSRAKFLYGCYGYNLDILARGPIWDLNIDYKCGTGHGVGYMLNIHEGPTGFRWYIVSSKNEHHQLEEGMVLTDEPGIYIDGSHGIRIENEFIVSKGEKNEFGQFMYLDTITYAPIDLDGINPDLLNHTEKEWLNQYHKRVYEYIAPHLNDKERKWLVQYTKAI